MGSGWETVDREQYSSEILTFSYKSHQGSKFSQHWYNIAWQVCGSLYEQIEGRSTVILNIRFHIQSVTLHFPVAGRGRQQDLAGSRVAFPPLLATSWPCWCWTIELQKRHHWIYSWDTLRTCRETPISALQAAPVLGEGREVISFFSLHVVQSADLRSQRDHTAYFFDRYCIHYTHPFLHSEIDESSFLFKTTISFAILHIYSR